nr:hypothetical protein [Leptolyngbya sp. FACHB-36]
MPDTYPKVQELRQLSPWSEGQVWSGLEMHGRSLELAQAPPR